MQEFLTERLDAYNGSGNPVLDIVLFRHACWQCKDRVCSAWKPAADGAMLNALDRAQGCPAACVPHASHSAAARKPCAARRPCRERSTQARHALGKAWFAMLSGVLAGEARCALTGVCCSLTRLAAFVAGQTCVSIETTQGYSPADFRNELKKVIQQVSFNTYLCTYNM